MAACQCEFWNKVSQVEFVQHINLCRIIYQLNPNLLEKPFCLLSLLNSKKALIKHNGFSVGGLLWCRLYFSAAPGTFMGKIMAFSFLS